MDSADQTYLVQLKIPGAGIQLVRAAKIELQGEHLVLLDSKGKVAALYLLQIVKSWNVIPD